MSRKREKGKEHVLSTYMSYREPDQLQVGTAVRKYLLSQYGCHLRRDNCFQTFVLDLMNDHEIEGWYKFPRCCHKTLVEYSPLVQLRDSRKMR